MERYCVVCFQKQKQKQMHLFSINVEKRETWVNAVCQTPEQKRDLYRRLNATVTPYLCESHFRPTSYKPYTGILKDDAVPSYKMPTVPNATVSRNSVIPSYLQSSYGSPPPSPGLALPSSSYSRPPPLLTRPLPPCCTCCCRPETRKEVMNDPNWKPLPPTTSHLPSSEYLVVSTHSLVALLRQCRKCSQGENHLSFRSEGLAVTVTGECNSCGWKFTWGSSKILHTAKRSGKERLPKLNVDIVTGAVITSVGGTKLRQVMLMSGISPLSDTTFHMIKKHYVAPAVEEVFWKTQSEVIESLIARIAKGERVHIAGDGSFDNRGFSASWCRYFLLDAITQEVLHYVLIHKTDTGSSGTMEVAALEQGLRELSYMIGGEEGIASLVTDRHSAVTKMMKMKFPGIDHFFDPWHFFRNITLTLVTIAKANYMMPIRFWIRIIINRCYDAVTTSQGNGEMASEKFRAILLCMTGQHQFHMDKTFKCIKACSHSPPTDPKIFIPFGGRVYNRLVDQVFTAKNIEDIKSVSWLLQTSTCESINALAWRYSAKDYYFTRPGHDLRTRLTMIHWNHLKKTAADGSRPVREIDRLTRPLVPAAGDCNLEASDEESDEEDEDDGLALPPPTAAQGILAIIEDAEEEDGIEEEEERNEEEE